MHRTAVAVAVVASVLGVMSCKTPVLPASPSNSERVSPLPDLSGLYSLTITADVCPGAPANERTRTYEAQVAQDGPQLNVLLGGARFAASGGRGNGFSGRVFPNAVTFVLSDWSDYVYSGIYYNLVEILADSPPRLLTVSGTVSATASEAGISGLLDGTIEAVSRIGEYGHSPFEWWHCESRKHQFVLLRR